MNILFSKLAHYDSLKVKNYEADSIVTGVLDRLCWEYKYISIDTALCYCNEALRIAEKNNYKTGIANTYAQFGQIYNQRGDFAKAMDFFTKTLKIWRSYQYSNTPYYNSAIIKKEAITMNNMASVFGAIGDIRGELELYYQALAINEKIGYEEGVANTLGNIGNVFFGQKQYKKAIEYFSRIIPVYKKKTNSKFLAFSYLNIGESYRQLGDLKSAREYLSNASDIAVSQGDKQTLSIIYVDLALTYDADKNYDKEEEFYQKALVFKKETDDKIGIATVLGNIGSMYSDKNMLFEAEKYLLQSLAIADSINAVGLQKDNHINLSELYAKAGDYKKALLHNQKGMAANDSLFNQKKTEEITTQTLNYKFKKQQDSARTEYDKQIAIGEANKKTAIAVAEKKRLLAEADKKLQVSEADKKRLIAETESKKTTEALTHQQMLAAIDKKNAQQKIALSNAATAQQKLIRNSIIGGSAGLTLIGLLGFVNFRNKRKREKAELSQQVSATEMKALRSQMNPHFIFNALQSIQTFLLSHQSDEANIYLVKFSKLMRAVLENSQHAEVPLKNDIEALELYMQLESIRLTHPFTYKFHIDENVDTYTDTIPPLILQPFVENAIWHGLQYKPEPGHINIYISKNEGTLYVMVEDNGIGRNMSKQIAQPMLLKKESLGMKLTEERLKVMNEIKKTNAHFTITDLFTKNNEPTGTKVQLLLPLIA